jgi:carbamoyl-phosphate synthase small subunit
MWRWPMTRTASFDIEALVAAARGFPGSRGSTSPRTSPARKAYRWDEMRWAWPEGYTRATGGPAAKVVALDYGAKRNILRCLASAGCDVTVLPATATAEEVLAQNPDGVFLSNGPGDPAATGEYAVPMIRACSTPTCRSSASASATRCWRWRWGRGRSR